VLPISRNKSERKRSELSLQKLSAREKRRSERRTVWRKKKGSSGSFSRSKNARERKRLPRIRESGRRCWRPLLKPNVSKILKLRKPRQRRRQSWRNRSGSKRKLSLKPEGKRKRSLLRLSVRGKSS
jgi:hypothetical protein